MLAETPLTSLHRSAGAKMGPFAGYDMPIQYVGILSEHDAVRHRAGIFDVSHMGHCLVVDPAVSFRLSRPLEGAAVGKSNYLLILNEGGGIVDDCIAYRLAERRWHLIVNAARKEIDFAALGQVSPMRDLAMIALQGPLAMALADSSKTSTPQTLCARRSFATDVTVLDVPVELVARTGYTGEDGYEFVVKSEHAPALWEKLRAAGAEPCGLAARDLLRIEAALPLYGADIDETTSPLETGLEFALDLNRDFIARVALTRNQPQRRRAGLKLPKGAIPRANCSVLDSSGSPIGSVTSGTFSPMLDSGIALALVRREAKPEFVEIRGRACPAEEVALPFYRRTR